MAEPVSGQPPEYVQEQLFQEINEWINARFPLDNELNLIGQSINAVIARLALIQRDDGELANESVGYDQLKPEVVPGGIGLIAPWVDMRQYSVRDSVFYVNSWYVCKKAHTASPTNRPDVDVPPGETEGEFWVLINDFSALFEDVLEDCEEQRDFARDWATAPEDQEVDDGVNPPGFSAFHWSEKTQEKLDSIQPDLDQLQANIDAEEQARIAADDGLQTNIDAEEQARIAADDALQSEVDDLEANKVDKVAGDTGAAKLPYGTEAQRPGATTDPLLRGRTEDGEAEYFNPVTGEWGQVGGGGVPPMIPVSENTLAARNKVYAFSTPESTVQILTIPEGLANFSFVGIHDEDGTWNQTGATGVVFQLSGSEVFSQQKDGVDQNSFSVFKRNSTIYIQKGADGKWNLVQANYGSDFNYVLERIGESTDWVEVGSAGAPPFLNSWGNLGAPWQNLRFRRFNDVAFVEGAITGGAVGTAIFTLPEGLRPSNDLMYPCVAQNAIGRIDVQVNGNVALASGTLGFASVCFSFNIGD